jgi:type I restriction enzyme S subunit
MSWAEIALSELVEFSPKISLEKGELYDHIPMEAIDSGIKYPRETYQKEYTGGGTKFANGDTLFARITPCLENGKIAKVKDLEKQVGFGSTEYFVLRAKENISDSDFVYYLAKTDLVRQTAIKSMSGADGRQRADKGAVEQLMVLNIPLPTQRKIASILSAYDDLIENNLKRIKLLEAKAQLHYTQYKPIVKIALQEIADYLGRGVTPKYEEGSGFYAINQKANKGSLLEYSQFKALDSKLEVPEDKLAKWGDLLINSLGEGTLGRVHFYTDKSDLYAVDQHMSIFRTLKQHYTFYLYQFLSSNYGQGLLDSLKKGGTNMTMLNISDLRQLIVSFPPEKDLVELWIICKPLFQLKQTLITQNTKLREARDILLPKLMNGQIEV